MTREEQLQRCSAWYKAMHEKMEAGCDKGRAGWLDDPVEHLISRFHEELAEFFQNPAIHEAADVANFIFMIQERMVKE